MTTSQNTCPALAGIAKAILTNLNAEDLADVLRSVEPAVMQEALVRSEIIGMDPSHFQLAIDHELVAKEAVYSGLDFIADDLLLEACDIESAETSNIDKSKIKSDVDDGFSDTGAGTGDEQAGTTARNIVVEFRQRSEHHEISGNNIHSAYPRRDGL